MHNCILKHAPVNLFDDKTMRNNIIKCTYSFGAPLDYFL